MQCGRQEELFIAMSAAGLAQQRCLHKPGAGKCKVAGLLVPESESGLCLAAPRPFPPGSRAVLLASSTRPEVSALRGAQQKPSGLRRLRPVQCGRQEVLFIAMSAAGLALSAQARCGKVQSSGLLVPESESGLCRPAPRPLPDHGLAVLHASSHAHKFLRFGGARQKPSDLRRLCPVLRSK